MKSLVQSFDFSCFTLDIAIRCRIAILDWKKKEISIAIFAYSSAEHIYKKLCIKIEYLPCKTE